MNEVEFEKKTIIDLLVSAMRIIVFFIKLNKNMIPINDAVICFTCECELTEGNILTGFKAVVFRSGYWKIVESNQNGIVLEEVWTKKRKAISYGMLGTLFASKTKSISLLAEDDIPEVITLQG